MKRSNSVLSNNIENDFNGDNLIFWGLVAFGTGPENTYHGADPKSVAKIGLCSKALCKMVEKPEHNNNYWKDLAVTKFPEVVADCQYKVNVIWRNTFGEYANELKESIESAANYCLKVINNKSQINKNKIFDIIAGYSDELLKPDSNPIGQYCLGYAFNQSGFNKNSNLAFKYFKLAADQGYAAAQNYVGMCYWSGDGVAKDLVQAFKYYKLAADQGYALAQDRIGMCYTDGDGVAKDLVQAFEYFKLAADQGDAAAQNNLAMCYISGDGVAKNLVQAFKYYKLAADQGNADGQWNLARCYKFGNGVAKDLVQAFKYYKLAADQGDADAQNNLAACYANGNSVAKDLVQAFKYYKLAADQGNAQAQLEVGMGYDDGKGVAKDLTQAFKYYKLAADQGDAQAQLEVGMRYDDGKGVAKDLTQAFKYYKLAADQGNAHAQLKVGKCFYKGKGVAQDFNQAFQYFKLSNQSDEDLDKSIYYIALCYEKGHGTNIDLKMALEHYIELGVIRSEKAWRRLKFLADQGNLDAVLAAGGFLCNYWMDDSIGTRPESMSEFENDSVKYLKLAADQGHLEAKEDYADHIYDIGCSLKVRNLNEDAFKYFKLAADQGNPIAQLEVGKCFYRGKGVEMDYDQALKYYKLAASNLSHPYIRSLAQVALGTYHSNEYYNGNGLEINLTEAFNYFKLAADAGCSIGKANLGHCYKDGEGVDQDFAKAFECYINAGCNAEARYSLGEFYQYGVHVAQDLTKALAYYKDAARYGNVPAKKKLETPEMIWIATGGPFF